MKGRKIPTFAGVLLIAIGIVSGVAITSSVKRLKIGVSDDIVPKDIRISNITATSFNVSWITNTKTSGVTRWNTTPSNFKRQKKDSIENPGYTHSVKIENLSPSTTYYFLIYSNNRSFDNNDIPWQVKTASKNTTRTNTNVISGSVYDQFNLPTKNALVYVTVAGSSFLSTTTSGNGSWVIPISEARTQNLESFIIIDEHNTPIEIFVQTGPFGNASAQIYPISAKPAPPIILGQIHNFKAINSTEQKSPKAEINLPDGLKNPTFLINKVVPDID